MCHPCGNIMVTSLTGPDLGDGKRGGPEQDWGREPRKSLAGYAPAGGWGEGGSPPPPDAVEF